jgi:hypothetical protein
MIAEKKVCSNRTMSDDEQVSNFNKTPKVSNLDYRASDPASLVVEIVVAGEPS